MTEQSRKTITISGGIIDEYGICKASRRKASTQKAKAGPKTVPALRSKHLDEIRKGYLELTQRLEAAKQADPAETRPSEILAPMPAKEEKKNEEFLNSLDFMTEFVKKSVASLDKPVATAVGGGAAAPKTAMHTPPKWGCLKNGELPTYRTWQKTRKYAGTSQAPPPPPPTRLNHLLVQDGKHRVSQSHAGGGGGHYIPGPPVVEAETTPKLPPSLGLSKGLGLLSTHAGNKQKRIVRRTFRVGKSKKAPTVSVVLNNQHIREKIATQKKTLRRTPIHQIKQKLVQAGMIRVGSMAPENVLREIYENMYLIGGPVMNFNPDIMYYNMLNPGEGRST